MDVAGGSEGTRATARREFGVLDFKTGRAIYCKSGETIIIPVHGHPVAAGLRGQCCELRVGYQIAASVGVFAEADKYGPMLRSRVYDGTMRLGN